VLESEESAGCVRSYKSKRGHPQAVVARCRSLQSACTGTNLQRAYKAVISQGRVLQSTCTSTYHREGMRKQWLHSSEFCSACTGTNLQRAYEAVISQGRVLQSTCTSTNHREGMRKQWLHSAEFCRARALVRFTESMRKQ